MPDFLQNLINNISDFLPGVLSAILVLIIGYIVAKILKVLVTKIIKKTSIDDKIGGKVSNGFRLDNFIGKLVYYLVLVYTLIIVLGMMGLDGVLDPLNDMLKTFTSAIPNIVKAGIIGFAGYVIAKVVSEAVGALSATLEAYSDKMGLTGSIDLSSLLKKIIFLIIFIPMLIAAIDALGIRAISEPATKMLETIISAIPMIITAALILAVFYFVGTYVINILKELMKGAGVDSLAEKMGIAKIMGNKSLSNVLGSIAFFFIMFMAVITALDKLEMESFSDILNDILAISGKVLFGLIIIMVGGFIANVASKAISDTSNKWMAPIIKFGILGLFIAFALNTMGIAGHIVNLAFGLTLGAVAVAFALAFGLGGREPASKLLSHYVDKIRNKK